MESSKQEKFHEFFSERRDSEAYRLTETPGNDPQQTNLLYQDIIHEVQE